MADDHQTLAEELAELERTDPAVKRAADNYDLTVRRILRRARAKPALVDPEDS